MIIGQKCLVNVKSSLVLAEVVSIHEYNVAVKVLGNELPEVQVIDKENVIGSVSKEAFETIKEHQNVLVKEGFQ